MAKRSKAWLLAMAILAACGGQDVVATQQVPVTPTAEVPPPTVAIEPTPTSAPVPLTATAGDLTDDPAPAAAPEEWAFTLQVGALLVAADQGVWQVDRETDEAELIIRTAATRAFEDGKGTVVYQTTAGTIRARRGDTPDRLIAEPGSGETLTLAGLAVRPDGGEALLVRRAGGDDPVEELVLVGIDDGVERSLGEVGRDGVTVSSVSAHNQRIAVTVAGDGGSRVSFLKRDGVALEFDGNPQPTLGAAPEILVADIDEEQIFSWIERSGDGSLRLIVGNYKNGGAYRESELGAGWHPTHITSTGGVGYVISRQTESGEPMAALRVLDRDGTLAEAPGPPGFTTSVGIQTEGPWRFARELDGDLELWCRSDLVSTATLDAFGSEPAPLGVITDEDRAEFTEGLARWLGPPDENGEFPPVGEIVIVQLDEQVIVGLPVLNDPTRVSLAISMQRTTDGWAGNELVACSGRR